MLEQEIELFAKCVMLEIARARGIHGPFPKHWAVAFNILVEELGEISQGLNNAVANGGENDWYDVYVECVHLGAMCARFATEVIKPIMAMEGEDE